MDNPKSENLEKINKYGYTHRLVEMAQLYA